MLYFGRRKKGTKRSKMKLHQKGKIKLANSHRARPLIKKKTIKPLKTKAKIKAKDKDKAKRDKTKPSHTTLVESQQPKPPRELQLQPQLQPQRVCNSGIRSGSEGGRPKLREAPESPKILKPHEPLKPLEPPESLEVLKHQEPPEPWEAQLGSTDPFREAKVILRFQSGVQAKAVHLLEGNVVRKQYARNRMPFCRKEVTAMRHLRSSGVVPQLLWAHPDKPYFYMEYCGPDLGSLKELEANQVVIDAHSKLLHSRYGIYHNDIKPSNVCRRGGRIYLIDLGWCNNVPYKLEEGKKPGYNTVSDYVEHKKRKRNHKKGQKGSKGSGPKGTKGTKGQKEQKGAGQKGQKGHK